MASAPAWRLDDDETPERPLALRLGDGRPATLRLTPVASVIAVGEVCVSSYDLCGRPFAIVGEEWTSRRALDGRLLQKRAASGDEPRARRLLSAEEAIPVVEAARREATEVLAAVEAAAGLAAAERAEARRRLRRIAAMDASALRRDAVRFAAAYGRVGILPPDQYLALVVQVTQGCSWNACTFCDLYRGIPFRVKSPAEFAGHLSVVQGFFGESLVLRRSLFLGDANALCVGHERLLPLLRALAREFPIAPAGLGPQDRRTWLRREPRRMAGIHAFVDAWTGHRKGVAEYREYARLGLRRVYVGLETGDPRLLSWLGKLGSPADAVELVATLHEAGIAAGVIVLTGAGGERFFTAHVRETAEALSRMCLGPEDLLYFSELVDHPRHQYARRADAEDLRPLGLERARAQRAAIEAAFRPADAARPPRTTTYDIREFIY